jgi:hypothetical protein
MKNSYGREIDSNKTKAVVEKTMIPNEKANDMCEHAFLISAGL